MGRRICAGKLKLRAALVLKTGDDTPLVALQWRQRAPLHPKILITRLFVQAYGIEKYQSLASLALLEAEIQQWSAVSLHKEPLMWKVFSCSDTIIKDSCTGHLLLYTEISIFKCVWLLPGWLIPKLILILLDKTKPLSIQFRQLLPKLCHHPVHAHRGWKWDSRALGWWQTN